MGRRPKNMTIQEKIEFIKQQIIEKETDLKDLKSKLKDLYNQKEQEEMSALYLEIQNQGLSIEDAMEKLKK